MIQRRAAMGQKLNAQPSAGETYNHSRPPPSIGGGREGSPSGLMMAPRCSMRLSFAAMMFCVRVAQKARGLLSPAARQPRAKAQTGTFAARRPACPRESRRSRASLMAQWSATTKLFEVLGDIIFLVFFAGLMGHVYLLSES